MPRRDKSSYIEKQKHKAEHIEEDYERRGVSHREAERRAWHGLPPSAVSPPWEIDQPSLPRAIL